MIDKLNCLSMSTYIIQYVMYGMLCIGVVVGGCIVCKMSDTYFPASSTTVASINSVDLSFTITWQLSTSGDMTLSSSSSFEPDAVLVGASSGMIREPLLLLSNVVSASFRVCAIFSMTLPPVVKSAMFGFRAARCFLARTRRAYYKIIYKYIYQYILYIINVV